MKNNNKPYVILDSTKPEDVKEMERQLKEKYEASQKAKSGKKSTA